MKYYVSITEILNRVVSVEADSEFEAVEQVQDAYNNCDIVLDSEDYVDTRLKLEADQESYRLADAGKFGPIYQQIQ